MRKLKGWKSYCLSDLADRIDYGLTASAKESDSGPKFLRITDIQNGSVDWSSVPTCDCSHVEQEKYHLHLGDIVFARTGATTGKSYLITDMPPQNTVFASYLIRVRPSDLVLPQYLGYFFQTPDYWAQINRHTSGSAQPGVNATKLKELTIPLPPLPEQKRIVAILDEAFAAIETARVNTERSLEGACGILLSKLDQVLGTANAKWAITPLSELAHRSLGKMLDKQKNRGELYPYLRNLNVRWFDFDLSDISQMRFEESERERYSARCGDLLICEGGYPGRAAIWSGSEPIYFQKAIHRVRFHNSIHTKWFHYFLYYLDATGDIRQYFTGTGIQHFTGASLANVQVPVPPSEEIIAHVVNFEAVHSEMDELVSLYEKKLILLTELRQSLLHKAFADELTAYPRKVPGISATELHVGILAIAYRAHEKVNRLDDFGRTKGEKIIHMVESYCGIDLDRVPIKDAAGPNDFAHVKRKVEPRALKAGYFKYEEMVTRKRTTIDGMRILNSQRFNGLIDKSQKTLGDRYDDIHKLIELMLPMNTRQAEIFATVFAAWNNLLIDGLPISDEAIVYEARENWHPEKLKIPEDRFFKAITWMKEHGIEPRGLGKKVI